MKNLLEAENEAKLIVEEAMNERNKLMQDANVKAAQEVNERRKKWEQKLQDEAEKVSSQLNLSYILFSYDKRGRKSTECKREVPLSWKRSTSSTTTTKIRWLTSYWSRLWKYSLKYHA